MTRRKRSAAERTIPLFGLQAGDVLRVAAKAGVDPRTVRAVVDGKGSRLSRAAVLEALHALRLTSVAEQVEAQRV